MPSNAAWIASRVVRPTATDGSTTAVGGDSVDIRMKRARDAAERAREAEEHAVEAAQESKGRSHHVREVSERGRARVADVERETNRLVKQRLAAAQKAADAAVKRERQEAEADADEQRKEVRAEIDEEIEDAQRDAEEAQRRAEEIVVDATEKLAAARRLAEEATETARTAAEEAHQQAQQLAGEAEQHATEAEARVTEAEQLRGRSEATAKHTARELDRAPTNGLESYRKPELIELAASIGIEGRTNMTKGELIDAIANASRAKR
jgi:colicin import membrane protein